MIHDPFTEDEAVDWLLRWYCGRLSTADRHAYLQWLKASPAHIAETVRWCRRYYKFRLRTRPLQLVLMNDSFSTVTELPPSPELTNDEVFKAELIRAVRAYPVDTETLVRNARAALAARRRRRSRKAKDRTRPPGKRRP